MRFDFPSKRLPLRTVSEEAKEAESFVKAANIFGYERDAAHQPKKSSWAQHFVSNLEIPLGILFVVGPGWLAHRLIRTPRQAAIPLAIVITKIMLTDPSSQARMLYLAWFVVLACIIATRPPSGPPPESSFHPPSP